MIKETVNKWEYKLNTYCTIAKIYHIFEPIGIFSETYYFPLK